MPGRPRGSCPPSERLEPPVATRRLLWAFFSLLRNHRWQEPLHVDGLAAGIASTPVLPARNAVLVHRDPLVGSGATTRPPGQRVIRGAEDPLSGAFLVPLCRRPRSVHRYTLPVALGTARRRARGRRLGVPESRVCSRVWTIPRHGFAVGALVVAFRPARFWSVFLPVMKRRDGEPACRRGSVTFPGERRWPSI